MPRMTQDQLDQLIAERIKEFGEKHLSPEVRETVEAATEHNINQRKAESVAEKILDEPKPQPDVNDSKFGCFVRAVAFARAEGGGRAAAAEMADKSGHPDVAKALSAGNPTSGGFLVPVEFANEVIELRRALGVVRSLNPTIIPMSSGTIELARVNQGATSSYGSENANNSATEQKFGQLKLSFKKLNTQVTISNDLLRYSQPSADGIVRDDCVASMRSREDLAFIGGDGVDGEPVGILNLVHGDNKFNANGTTNLANVTVDLGKALEKLMQADITLDPRQDGSVSGERAGWIFQPQIHRYLTTVQNGLGMYAFAPEMARGTLLGYPFRVSTQASASKLGRSANDNPVIFGAFRHAVIGDSMNLMVDASQDAAYYDGANVQAAFSRDQTVIRVISEHDFNLRHDKAFAVIEQVNWPS